MKKKIIVIFIIIFLVFLCIYVYSNQYHINNGIPIVDIRLKDIDIEDVHKDKKIEYENNSIKIYDNNKRVLNGIVGIKGRGNYTWRLAKKPYRISFEEKTEVLDLPVVKKYVLLANYTDPSLIKNDFTYSVAKKMDLGYSFTGRFVDLYIDKHYMGNYYMTPKIDISEELLPLKDDKALLMELDNNYYRDEEVYFQSSYFNDYIVLKDFNKDDYEEALDVFKMKYNNMEKCILKKDYDCLDKVIDIDSFIKYYVIAEFAKNFDSLKSSLFFYTDGDDDKIHIGPVWDFDVAYGTLEPFLDPDGLPIKDDLVDEAEASKMFYNFLKVKGVNKKVKKYWRENARSIYKEEIDNLDKKFKYLKKSGDYNNRYWMLKEYDDATKSIKKWLEDRYEYMDKVMGE